MASTTDTERTTHTALDIAKAQQDAFEALSENFASAQKHGMDLANGGLELLQLQERSARAGLEWFSNGVKLLQLQQRNAEFVQRWANDAVNVMREQSENNLRTAETFARTMSVQQDGYRSLTEQWIDSYRNFFSPLAYTRAARDLTERGLETAKELTDQTQDVLRQTERITREAELRVVVSSALGAVDYSELTVDEVSERLDNLTIDELNKVREFETQNEDRTTLIDEIDRKIRADS